MSKSVLSLSPQQMVMQLLQNNKNNPLAQQMIAMMNGGDARGLEQMARNIAQQRGLDFDTEFGKFKKAYGLDKGQ